MLPCRISLAGRDLCGVAVILSSVASEDFAAVDKWRGVPGRAGTICFSDLPGVRALSRIWSRCTLVNPRSSTWRAYTHVGHVFHRNEKSQPLLTEGRFSPGFARVGVVTASITVSSPASFLTRRSRLSFLNVRTSSVSTCRKYVQR